jgi:hypothetical protein
VQPLLSREAEKKLQGLHPLPSRQAERQLRGMQPLSSQQAETRLREVQRAARKLELREQDENDSARLQAAQAVRAAEQNGTI